MNIGRFMDKINSIVIYDTEFWTDEGCQGRRWRGLSDHPPMLIQFGGYKVAVKEGLPEIDKINLMVQPSAYGEILPITDYFEELTGISQARVNEEGVPMKKAFEIIKEFIGDDHCLSYGFDERATLLPSAYLNDLDFPFKATQFHDFRQTLHRAGWSEEKIFENTSGTVAKTLGLEVEAEGGVHDAAYDALSLLVSLRHIIDQGQLELDQILVR